MPDASARNLQHLILLRVSQVGMQSVAESLEVATSTVSRWVSCQQGIPLDKLEDLFEVLGLYVSEDSTSTQEIRVSTAHYEALRTLAREALD